MVIIGRKREISTLSSHEAFLSKGIRHNMVRGGKLVSETLWCIWLTRCPKRPVNVDMANRDDTLRSPLLYAITHKQQRFVASHSEQQQSNQMTRHRRLENVWGGVIKGKNNSLLYLIYQYPLKKKEREKKHLFLWISFGILFLSKHFTQQHDCKGNKFLTSG